MIESIFGFVMESIDRSFFWFRAVFNNVGIDILNFLIVSTIVLFAVSLLTNTSSGLNRSLRDIEPRVKERYSFKVSSYSSGSVHSSNAEFIRTSSGSKSRLKK